MMPGGCSLDPQWSLALAARATSRLRSSPRQRRGTERPRAMTLLETILAMTLMTVVSLLGAQAVRISWQAWEIQDERSDRFQYLGGVLAHITRHLRMARSVVDVSDAADTSGSLAITLPDDSVVKWDHKDDTRRVFYGVADPPTDLLAKRIDELTFECFELDGVTPTTVPADVRMIRTTASITLPVQGTPFALSSTVWIRKQQDGLAAEFVDFYATNSSTPIGWQNHGDLIGPPDGLPSSGPPGARVRAFGFDPTGYTGKVGTVLVGLYLKTDSLIDEDFLDVQIDRGSLGPVHSFGKEALKRFDDNTDWFWVDVTNHFAWWTYEDLSSTRVEITNRDAGSGGTTIRLDSVKIRTFEAKPATQTFWMTGLGTDNEWLNPMGALGPPDGTYAQSTFEAATDRQSYSYPGSWEDLGTIVRVRLLVDFYVTATFVDDEFKMRLRSTAGPGEYLQIVPIPALNQHVGIGNQGTVSEDFSNHESWTWPSINSHEVRLQAKENVVSDGNIYVDAVGLEVRYVPPNQAAVVLWEELLPGVPWEEL